MRKVLAVIVAAVFSGASFQVFAQDKAAPATPSAKSTKAGEEKDAKKADKATKSAAKKDGTKGESKK